MLLKGRKGGGLRLATMDEMAPVDALVMAGGCHITVHCPVCHSRLIDPHEAPDCHINAGGRLWLECTRCPRQIEVELKYTTRWIGKENK